MSVETCLRFARLLRRLAPLAKIISFVYVFCVRHMRVVVVTYVYACQNKGMGGQKVLTYPTWPYTAVLRFSASQFARRRSLARAKPSIPLLLFDASVHGPPLRIVDRRPYKLPRESDDCSDLCRTNVDTSLLLNVSFEPCGKRATALGGCMEHFGVFDIALLCSALPPPGVKGSPKRACSTSYYAFLAMERFG